VAHIRWVWGVEAAFLLFALGYLALERFRRGRHRVLLGALHVSATFLGANLIFLPQHLLGLLPRGLLPSGLDTFFWFNGVASAGYVLMLAGQLIFVAVLLDAFRREPIPR
jgi:cytochrome c oxidase subunit 1